MRQKRAKRILAILLAVLMVLATVPAAKKTAKAGYTTYNLWIDGVQVTEQNRGNILGDEYVTFEYSEYYNTLYVYGDYTSTSNDLIVSGIEDLTIQTNGRDVTLTAPQNKSVIVLNKYATITSYEMDKITLVGGNGIFADGDNTGISIQDANMEIYASIGGIVGNSELSAEKYPHVYVRNSDVFISALLCVCYMTQVWNFKSRILEPSGATFRDGDHCILNAGGHPAEEVIFVSESTDLTGLLNQSGEDMRFFTGGDYLWYYDTDNECARSGNAGVPSSASLLQANVTLDEPMRLSFEVKCMGEGNQENKYDYGYLNVDHTFVTDWIITDDWVNYYCDLEPGEHNLRWTYEKDSSVNNTGDALFLRNVRLNKLITSVDLRVEMVKPGEYFESPNVKPTGDAHYSVESAMWVNQSYATIHNFQVGQMYALQVVIQPDEGYMFAEPAVTLNGQNYPVINAALYENGSMLIQSAPIGVREYLYSDVAIRPWQWAYEGIMRASEAGIMTGDKKKKESDETTTFRPKDEVKRAEFVMILARLDGGGFSNQTESGFSDVPYDPNKAKQVYYFDNLAWANFHGIVSGYPDGTFRPKNAITRADMAVMLQRLIWHMYGTDSTYATPRADITGMADYNDVPKYARDAMSWAYATGLITGRNNGTLLAPRATTQRQECAAVVQRFINAFWEL